MVYGELDDNVIYNDFLNAQVYEDDLIYHFSWGIEPTAAGKDIQYFSYHGTKAEVMEFMLALRDNDRIVAPDLTVTSIKGSFLSGHVHMRDGERLEHTWEECTENPRSPNYNPE